MPRGRLRSDLKRILSNVSRIRLDAQLRYKTTDDNPDKTVNNDHESEMTNDAYQTDR